MEVKFIMYFSVAFISLCIGGFMGASFASGYYKTKHKRELDELEKSYRRNW